MEGLEFMTEEMLEMSEMELESMEDDASSVGKAPVIRMIEVEKIFPHPDNPRKDLGDLSELCDSIKESGIMQNLTVVPGSYGYTAVIGHRRLAAAKLAGLKEVPCVVRSMSEKEQQAVMLCENIQRNNLTLREQAEGLQRMFDLGADMQEVKKRTGFSESTIRRRINLFKFNMDELDKAEARGGTLDDYIKIAEIEDEERRDIVLKAVGTNSFEWELKRAKNAQREKRKKEAFIEKLKSFAEEMPKDIDIRTVKREKYYYDSMYNGEVDFNFIDGEKYYYSDDNYSVGIYRVLTEWEKEEANIERLQRRQEAANKEERHERCRELFALMYERRSEFVNSLIGKKIDVDKLIAFMVDKHISVNFYNEKSVRARLGLLGDDEMSLSEAAEGKFGDRAGGILLFVSLYADYYDCENRNCWFDYGSNCYSENYKLIELYDLLDAVGMEISDEEAALLDGSHEVYKVG